MKLTSRIFVGALLSMLSTVSFAQSIARLQNPGVVRPSAAFTVPYFVAQGNTVIGSSNFTFNPGTNVLTVPTVSASSLTIGTLNGCGTWTAGVAGSTGVACSTSTGSVNPGTAGQYSYYQVTGSTVGPLSSVNNAVATTNGSGVAVLSNTLPTLVQSNITGLGAVTSGALDNVPIGSTTPSTGIFTSLQDNGLTPGAVAYTNISNQLTTSSALVFNGVILTGVDADFQGYILTNSPVHGSHSVTIVPPATTFTDWTLTVPTTLGGLGQPLVSSGSGGVPATWGSLTGTGSFFATATSSPSDGCGTWATGSIGSTGTPCFAAPVGAIGTVYTGTGTGAAFSSSPTVSTSVTTPIVYGGTTSSSTLDLESTSGAGTTDILRLRAGAQVIMMNVTKAGVGIGSTAATAALQLQAGTATAGTSPLKFVSGTSLTTPETGAEEYDGNDRYFTFNGQRRNYQTGSMATIAAATITTTPANFATFNVVSGESYIVDINLKFTSSANTNIIGFNGATTGGTNTLTVDQMGVGLTTNGTSLLQANSASTVTCIGNALVIRISGIFTAAATGTWGINIHSNTGTIPLLAGSYYNYTRL